MTSEQRVWAASILSIVVLAAYATLIEWKTKATLPPSQSLEQPAPAFVSATPVMSAIDLLQHVQQEDIVTIENRKLRLELGKKSAGVRMVQLKDHHDLVTGTDITFSNSASYLVRPVLGDPEDQSWTLVSNMADAASWTKKDRAGLHHDLSIVLDDDLPTYRIEVTSSNEAKQILPAELRLVASWTRSDGVTGRYNMLEAVVNVDKDSSGKRTHRKYPPSEKNERIVPRGTAVLTLTERYFCQAIKPDEAGVPFSTTLLRSAAQQIRAQLIAQNELQPSGAQKWQVALFVGPRDFFQLRDAGFEEAFPIGWLGQIGLGIILLLRWIASLVHNYGIAIIILSVIVTGALAPFTLISVRSMKKMQQLQPKMEQLKKKYAGDSKRLNQETFALFKQHKVSPASGCLPMLLQMPIFFAFWSAISQSVEFRGATFLWIKDLSLPDRLAKLPIGLDLNVLPIAMAAAMFFQTKLSQPTSSGSPGANMLSGPVMPLMFGVMFYQVPSCLVLYWLTNSLISLLLYRTIKT